MSRIIATVIVAWALQQPASFSENAVIPAFHRVDATLGYFHTALRRTIDDRRDLLIVRAARRPITWRSARGAVPWGPGEALGVFLVDRQDATRVSEIAVLDDHLAHQNAESVLQLERVDASAIVLSQRDPDKGLSAPSLKLFIDPVSGRLLRRLDYQPIGPTRVVRADEQLCATMGTGFGSARLGCLTNGRLVDRGPVQTDPEKPAVELPRDLLPFPQSTYDEFASARPDRVQNNYRRANTRIEERIGPWQRVGSRIWFGKDFYDGEGTTGVGGLGYFDSVARSFTFLPLPALGPWSASALLIDGDEAWVGLVGHPEAADFSGGLLRVDLARHRTRRYEIPDIIHTLTRWNGSLYIGTEHGLYVLRDDQLIRHRLEPALDGGYIIVFETL